jgi:hypothetical protein
MMLLVVMAVLSIECIGCSCHDWGGQLGCDLVETCQRSKAVWARFVISVKLKRAQNLVTMET